MQLSLDIIEILPTWQSKQEDDDSVGLYLPDVHFKQASLSSVKYPGLHILHLYLVILETCPIGQIKHED